MSVAAAREPGTGRGSDDVLIVFSSDERAGSGRLRAIDAAGQPGVSTARDSYLTIVVAGQIYDPDRLDPDSSAPTTAADALLGAYRRLGPPVVASLRGAFAAFLWDARRELLLCIRDPLGISPLFYADGRGELVLSTSLNDLIAHPGVPNELNRAALADHLCHRWPDPGETYWEGVRRVPPGHVMETTRSGRTLRRYWNPAPPGSEPEWLDDEEVDRFDEVFERAVGRAFALGRPGIYLSGGLDSVSVAAVAVDRAARQETEAPVGLSLAFPTAAANEEAVQRKVATGLGIPHVLLPFDDAVGSHGLLEAALATSSAAPAPLMNIWYPAYRTLAGAGAREGCRVILTGGGGDEWLGVSPLLAADLIRSGDLRGLFRLWTTLSGSVRLSKLRMLHSVLWTFGSRPLLGAAAERHAPRRLAAYRMRRKRAGTPDWVAPDPALRAVLFERAAQSVTSMRADSFYLREGQLSLDHALISLEMEEVFDSGRETGLPVRMPYWDAELVDFLYRVRPEALNEGGRSKGLVRQMLSRRFPELGFERQRKVLATDYFTQTMARQAPAAWERMGGVSALEDLGIVKKTALQSAMENVFDRQYNQGVARIWNALTLEAWVRGHR